MIPAVRLPAGSKVRTPIDLKLKPTWRFDPKRRVFVSDAGEEFTPRGQLPRNSRIVYKVPSLVKADQTRLSKHERELRRYMQVILPAADSPATYLEGVRAWPAVAEANVAPEVSLPSRSS
jgi:hypothetical protein